MKTLNLLALTWAWNRCDDLGQTDSWVLRELATFMNAKTMLCCPSIATLMKGCKLSKSAVLRSLAALEAKGLIKSAARSSNAGRMSNSYSLPEYAAILKATKAKGAVTQAAFMETFEWWDHQTAGEDVKYDLEEAQPQQGSAKVIHLHPAKSL